MSPTDLPIKPRFYFHAEGHALSGEFRRPIQHSIAAQAATSLATIGGYARAHVEDFRAEHLVAFKRAHTHVSGSKEDDVTYTSHVTTTIEQLNILDVVIADRVVSHLTSQHKKGKLEGHILALGTHFDGLRIAGYPVVVKLRHELFIDCETFDQLRNRLATDKDSGKIAVTGERTALCSLVEKIETELPGVEGRSHIFHVPHFGQVSLAEVFAEPGVRSLTMIRLDLGSPTAATLTAAESKINGIPWP